MENIEVESDTEYEVEPCLNDIVNSVVESSVGADEVSLQSKQPSYGSSNEEEETIPPQPKRTRKVTQKRLDSLEVARGKRKEIFAKQRKSEELVKKFDDLEIDLETLLNKLNEKRELERLEEEQYELELQTKIEKCPVQNDNWNSDVKYLPRASTNPFASQRYTRNFN